MLIDVSQNTLSFDFGDDYYNLPFGKTNINYVVYYTKPLSWSYYHRAKNTAIYNCGGKIVEQIVNTMQ